MNIRILDIFLAAGVAALFASCASTPLKYYPNFPSRKGTLGQTILLQDVFIPEETPSDTEKFDAVWNRRMGDSLLNYIENECVRRDYSISRTLFASMGMPMGGRTAYSLASTAEEQELDIEELPKRKPPFFIHEEFDSSAEAKRQWKSICRSLIQSPFEPEATHTIIADAPEFGKRLNVSTMIVCFASGFTVPVGERAKDIHLPQNKPQGYTAEEKISQASMTLYVIDVEGGELLWSDQTVIRGGSVYLGKLYVLIDRILDRLP